MESDAIIVWSRAGLANRLHALVNATYIRQRTGRPVYSCWPLNDHLAVPVTALFTYPFPLTEESIALTCLQSPMHHVVGFIRSHPGRQISVRTPLVLDEISSSFIRETLRTIQWQPLILAQVQREKLQYDLTPVVTGIHARGQDISTLSQLQIHVNRALGETTGRILLCTDESQLCQGLNDTRVTILRRPSRWSVAGVQTAVVDLLLLSSTTIRYYSPMSTYSWVAIALSNTPTHRIPRRQVNQVLTRLM
jgi:hypothetical protein